MQSIRSAIFKTFLISLMMAANINFSYSQTASILPPAKTTFNDANGHPLSGGNVQFYIPSTTTPKTTWQDAAETIPNTNPVILDSAGRALILGSGSYRQIVKDQNNNIIWDQVTASSGSGSSGPTATGDGDLVGTIKPWAGVIAPNQYMFAYGETVSRASFPALLAAITSTQATFCSSASPIITGLTDTTNFWIGMPVELSCVVGGQSTIISKTSTSVTLAANSNVNQNVNATFFPWGNGNGINTFTLPDLRGLIPVGNNNMGGVASTNLTTTFFGSQNPNSIGAKGGNQSSTLGTANLPAYTPTGTVTYSSGFQTAGFTVSAGPTSLYTTSGGAGVTTTFNGGAQGGTSTPFSILPPVKTVNYIIKVTPDANSATVNGVTDINGMTGSISCGTGLTCTGNIISVNININHPNSAIYATDFGVKCDNSTDDTTDAQIAINAAKTASVPVIFPSGICIISTTLSYILGGSTFVQGGQIIGQGREGTIFDFRGNNSCLFTFESSANGNFLSGITFSNFKIINSTSTALACGIEVYRAAYAKFDNIQMTGLSGNGIFIPASAGDADASFQISYDRVRMDNVGTTDGAWCNQLNAPSGGYFGSNLRVANSSFSGCGLNIAHTPPTSGAFEFKGLIAQFENDAFTINNNVDLYIEGPDTSLQVTIDGTDFENNISSVMPHIYVDGGLRGFKMTNSECLNNDGNLGQGCVWFNSASAPIGNVLIDKTEVRATTGNNPYIAFKNSGANSLVDTMRVSDIYWQTFDGTGQTRFSGFNPQPFASIAGQVRLSVISTNSIGLTQVGYGATVPIKLAATGEWVAVQLPSGGISQALGPLSASTTYNFYAYNSAATNAPYVIQLVASSTGTVLDNGYNVLSGDSTRTFVGSITTDGSGNFTTSSIVSSWYAQNNVASNGPLTAHCVVLGEGTSPLGCVNGTVGNSSLPLISQGASLDPVYTALSNAGLIHSSVTIGSTAIALGASSSSFAGLTLTTTSVNGVTIAAGQYLGEPSTGNATAGNIGEYVESVIPVASKVAISTGVAKTITSISLTAGDWDVDAMAYILPASGTATTVALTSISLSTNTLDLTNGRFSSLVTATGTFTGGNEIATPLPPLRFSLSTTTTIFMVAQSSFTGSTSASYGILRARRAR